MTDTFDLTDRQKELINCLNEGGADKQEIATRMGISGSGVKSHIAAIRDKGVNLEYDPDAKCYYIADQPKVRRLSTKHKGTITREANDFRTEQESAILRRLRRKDPLIAKPSPHQGNEDMVVAIGDVHLGDLVENQRGERVYDTDTAAASVMHVTEKALELKKFQEALVDFDTCHLFWIGDMVTGESIYEGQAYHTELMMADQLSIAVEVLTHQAESLAQEFDTLTITAVPGNHGEVRASYSSGQANMDLVCYRWVCDRLIDMGYDNIQFNVGEAKHYRNVSVRGWNYLARHGQEEQVHADATARSQADQRGLLHYHDFDVQIRGHWHTHREEDVMNGPEVITLPSPKPGSDFAEKIGRPDCSSWRKLGMIWRASDKRPITGKYILDDISLDMDSMDVPTIEDVRARSMQ